MKFRKNSNSRIWPFQVSFLYCEHSECTSQTIIDCSLFFYLQPRVNMHHVNTCVLAMPEEAQNACVQQVTHYGLTERPVQVMSEEIVII